ncbi:NFACT RNA binding domain-containing protein [Deinococcus sp.]|uniref:NFACT RNA binding domain-containing protein n=1 Tax=Deinococcus sp. TaxID=47478 RepID=UPI003C7E6C4F
MEGLMLAQTIREVQALLPVRTLGWAFPDETSAALLLEGAGNLVFNYRPPQPVIYLSQERIRGDAHNPFQRLLVARVRGDLLRAAQLKLDRVAQFSLSGERGFVDVAPARLLFELTGRNTNLLVLEGTDAGETSWEGRIVAAGREITGSRNRFRTVRSGGPYTPPPPYDKLDPRTMTEGDAASLQHLPLGKWPGKIDGLGLLLGAELVARAGLPSSEAPGEQWPKAWEALKSLVADPSVQEGTLQGGAREASRQEKAAQLRKTLREPLEKRLSLLKNQLADVDRAVEGTLTAVQERQEADLLMAYQHGIQPGAASVLLPAFDGSGEVPVSLEPQFSAVQNAEKRYTRARRREEVYERLAEREPVLRAELSEVQQDRAALEEAGLERLELLAKGLEVGRTDRSPFGAKYTSPGGFEVLVGRNNKENTALTHRIGRSTDFWFHVQGFPGSHVLVRSGGKELQLPDILFAAQLAAYHSKARQSGNVAVDYTRIKQVWRVKGESGGRVNYTGQKTVYVDPVLPA